MVRSSSDAKPKGSGSACGASTRGTAWGTGTAGSVVFCFGATILAQSDGTGTSGSFGGGFGSGFVSSFGSSFGQSGSNAGAFTFCFGSQAVTSGNASDSADASTATKELEELPDFTTTGKVPVGDIFVHGSGECDQLGLGDDSVMRERAKPALSKSRVGESICEHAVGAVQVLGLSERGAVSSLVCNDEGASGRAPSDGLDRIPPHVEPHPVTMPSGGAVRHVSCGGCHSCALDEKRRVWFCGTYKGISKQETENEGGLFHFVVHPVSANDDRGPEDGRCDGVKVCSSAWVTWLGPGCNPSGFASTDERPAGTNRAYDAALCRNKRLPLSFLGVSFRAIPVDGVLGLG
ncbi:rcc1 [Symbiodinium sp. CCMP2592]|nr:rcc1 [Symbiodinium sp. CCMP2592]